MKKQLRFISTGTKIVYLPSCIIYGKEIKEKKS
jgi:hypothetical protein